MNRAIEGPTTVLAIVIHGGWLALTAFHGALPWPVLAALGGWWIAWHGSLQHETIHGHPTRWAWANALVGSVPLSLWLPYRVYRRSHIAHHASPAPTHPVHDPESRYVAVGRGVSGLVARVRQTLIGQILVGPPVAIAGFLWNEGRRLFDDPRGFARDWVPHLIGVALVLAWLDAVDLPLPLYLLCFILPGQALSLIRSFAEHRADAAGPSRAATVLSRGPLALLFLNNNLHAAHHARPGAPWYRLPEIERNRAPGGEPRYAGYRDVAARFAFRAHDRAEHPQVRHG